jgi:hypothetical protein
MAQFGKKNNGPDESKRPAQTIEGKATEVSVEPQDEATSSAGTQDKGDSGEQSQSEFVPPPGPSRSKGLFSHLVAGLVGGLIAAAALAVAWSGFDLAGDKTVTPKLEAMNDRLAQVESATKTLETRAPETPPEFSALQERIGQAEATLKTLAEARQDSGSSPDAATVNQKIADAEQKLAAKIDAAIAKTDDAHTATVQALQDQIADLRTRLAALAEAGLAAETEELQPEIAALDRRVAKLEAAIPGIAEIVSKETEEAKAAALAIAFANLRAAVSEGRPYAPDLDALHTLSGDSDLDALAAHAKTGIPTMTALAQSFEAARDSALTEAPPASDGSLIGDLQARAQSLVTIRRLDEAATGNEPAAILARAKSDLGKGRLADSVREVETLDGAPRAAFAAWLDQAHARLEAEGELKRLESRLIVSVGNPARQSGRD